MIDLRGLKPWHWVALAFAGVTVLGTLSPSDTAGDTESTWVSLAIAAVLVAAVVWRVAHDRKTGGGVSKSVASVQAEIAELKEALAFFTHHETQFNEADGSGFIAKRDEHVVALVSEVGLVEAQRGPTEFKGGAIGFSFRVTDRIAVGPSRFRGTSKRGEERPTLIDSGRFVITDQRAVFLGGKQTREFDWDKLLAYELVALDKKSAMLMLPVSNRQKVSGIAADTPSMNHVHQRVAFGVAVATGRKDAFLDGLVAAIAEAEADLRMLAKPSP
jgi:hypothetical protein